MAKWSARAILALWFAPALLIVEPNASRATTPAGIVVIAVDRGSRAESIGIHTGDTLLSWKRAANPPLNPTGAEGNFKSPFDFIDACIEEAQRGAFVLAATRRGSALTFEVSFPHDDIETRPQFSPPALHLFLEGQSLFEKREFLTAAARWGNLAASLLRIDPLAAVWVEYKVGLALSEGGKPHEAQAVFDLAIRQAELNRLEIALKPLWRGKGMAFFRTNNYQPGIAASETLLTLCRASRDPSLWAASTLIAMASYSLHYGLAPEAESYGRRSLALAQTIAPHERVALNGAIDIALARHEQGDNAEAEKLLRLVVETPGRGQGRHAGDLMNLGVVLHSRGDFAGAEAAYREGFKTFEQIGDARAATMMLGNLCNVERERGDSEAAEQCISRVFKRIGDESEVFQHGLDWEPAILQRAAIALDRKDFPTAEKYQLLGLRVAEATFPRDSLSLASAISDMGELELRKGDVETATEYFRQALAIQAKASPDGLDAALSYQYLGQAAETLGKFDEAKVSYHHALRIRERVAPDSLWAAETLNRLGLLSRATGHTAEAADFLRLAIEALAAQGPRLARYDESRSVSSSGQIEMYRNYEQVLVELGHYERAFEILEASRGRSLLSMLAQRDLVLTADVPPELEKERKSADFEYDRVQEEIRELNPGQDAAKCEELVGRLRELRERQEEVGERIKRISPTYAALQYPKPLDLTAIQAALDPGTLLLSYSVGEEKSFLFGISPDSRRGPTLSVFTLPAGEKALRESVGALRQLIQWNKPSPDLLSRSRSLYNTLLKPAEALIAKSDRLLILPDGPLQTLPWAALVRDLKAGQPQYLVEWKPLHTAVSATVYAELKKSRRENRQPPLFEVAAFGDPKYPTFTRAAAIAKRGDGTDETAEPAEDPDEDPDVRAVTRGGYRLDPLPRSREEVQSIAKLYAPKAEAFLGAEATEERAKSLGKDIPLIHFACHAVLNERFPLDSALVLTIPEHPNEGQDNGLLQAWEIFERVRIDADLVTLSACDSGLGKEMGGEGLIGLTRAFQYAGARSILASLWKVEDQSTTELMKRFYGYLKGGKTKDEALRLAQIDLIHSPNFSQPGDWAAFELIGDWK